MTATVRITEKSVGYLTFDTVEEAKEWMAEPDDFDGVKRRTSDADYELIDPEPDAPAQADKNS